jgi:small subunit ribosomal protein S11
MSAIQHLLATDVISLARNQPNNARRGGESEAKGEDWGPAHEPFHFHIYSHRHNTHITVTKPNRCSILSMSAGNIGFKKGKRGTYDAAYQLCAYVLDKLNQGGWHRKITALEVVLRGFGVGREAATKVLLGNEGRLLRPHITKVSDSTRLKFGGTRSPKPRRLG